MQPKPDSDLAPDTVRMCAVEQIGITRWTHRLLGSLLVALAAAGCATSTPQPAPPTGSVVVPHDTQVQSAPASIQIPAIEVDAPLVPLGLEPDGTVKVPDLDHADQVSWYCQDYKNNAGVPTCAGGGVIPGDVGPAVGYGHIDAHRRDGVFKRLMELDVGDPINIRRADGTTLTFKVYKVQQVPKADFVTPSKRDAITAQVYGNRSRPELVLVTCVGDFIGGAVGYKDQGLVFAALA